MKRRTVKVVPRWNRLELYGGLKNGDECRVDGFKRTRGHPDPVFLCAVTPLDSDEVDHIEVLLRGHVRAFPPERIRNRFGYPLIDNRKET